MYSAVGLTQLLYSGRVGKTGVAVKRTVSALSSKTCIGKVFHAIKPFPALSNTRSDRIPLVPSLQHFPLLSYPRFANCF